jgi:enoyl-CoA hydratase
MSTVRFETAGPVAIVTIDRPEVRNAVDGPSALARNDPSLLARSGPVVGAALLSARSG